MTEKWYRLYCERCSYNRLTKGDDIDDLKEITAGKIPGKIPYYDQEKKKTVVPPWRSNTRRWKCPKCGRLIFPKVVPKPPSLPPDDTEERPKNDEPDKPA